jgi:protein SCO1/2
VAARLQLTLAVILGLVAVALAGVLLLGGDDDADRAGATVSPNGWAGAVSPPGIPPLDFALTDQEGRRVDTKDLRGRPYVLTFLYTTCEDTCPVTAQQIRGALDQVGEDVPVLAVSVDPGTDTAELARRFVLRQRMTNRMDFLLGGRPALERVWKAYGVQPQGEDFEHSARTLLVGADGRQRVAFPHDGLTPDAVAHDLRRLLRGA